MTSELRRWVMQFGAEAEVLSPQSLRYAIGRELRAASKAYASAASERVR